MSLWDRHDRLTAYLSAAACTLYTFVLLVRPDAWCPESMLTWWQTPRLFVTRCIEKVLAGICAASPSLEARYALYYFVPAGLVPWGVLALLGRARATTLGLRRRALQWFGMAQSTRGASGLRKTTRWLGLADGCTSAVVCSGVLFASVHLGKNPRELVLSLPGGLASAYLAYRTNSLLVPAALHFIVGAVATAVVYFR